MTERASYRLVLLLVVCVLFSWMILIANVLRTELRETSKEMDRRREWSYGVEATLKYMGGDRWRAKQEIETWKQFLDANPTLIVPKNFTPFEPPKPDPEFVLPEFPI